MRRSSYEQFAIVKTDSAHLFEKQLNEKICDLQDLYPEVSFSDQIPFYAFIKYHVSKEAPETISEVYEMAGACFVCEQCPCFNPALKEDGTEDKRCKVGTCGHPDNDNRRAFRRSPACDKLYEIIREGGVKICFTE